MQSNPISDALTLIKNAEHSGKMVCEVRPASNLLGRILKVMQENGYIGLYEYVENGRGGVFRVNLKGRINKCGAIKPRLSVRLVNMEKFESRYLPAQNFGVLILTTTAGIVSHKTAKEKGIGGKLLAYVY